MQKEKYNIGLDIGTSSVGWAVISTEDMSNPKILRKGNKYLWGARLFDEAVTAENRRLFRGTRRRYDRRRKRIKLLQEIFQEEINKVDPNFFQKMRESFYQEDDDVNKKIKLTKEEKKRIKDYNKKYPTIYHLRDTLINSTEDFDIRLIYLAIHHIIKYRGNFLNEMESFSVDKINIPEKLQEIVELISELSSETPIVNLEELPIDYEELEKCVTDISRNDRKVKTKEYLSNFFDSNFVGEFCKLIIGNKFKINKMFNIESETQVEISFKGTDYEDKLSDITAIVGEKIEILESIKELYDMLFLKELFKGRKNTSISSLMVDKYNEHKEDLAFLKSALKDKNEVYVAMFKDSKNKKCIYREYVDNAISYDEFIKKFEQHIDEDNKKYIEKYKKKIEEGTFLPRITDKDNGKYPYQLNKDELIKIILNHSKQFKFLEETVKENDKEEYKLVRLLSFRIPYYIGPLNSTTNVKGVQNKNSWMSLKDGYKISDLNPYNFNQIVDKDKSAEEFIRRMLSKCTYILDEYAMANNSILYSKYKVLNELKQISINGDKIEPQYIMDIYNELFLTKKGTITDKLFKQYLLGKDYTKQYNRDIEIKGYSAEEKFANNMNSYIDFFGEDGIFKDTEYELEDAEKIIEWITIFEDKDILERKVRQSYTKLSDEKIKKIISKKYKGWGNLSKKLLTEVYYTKDEYSERKSILDLMEETKENFMQILFNEKYKFQEKIDKLNSKNENKKVSYSLVEELATSPANKRGIYQALKVVDELIKYIGYKPEHICIEMARGEENSGRTQSRKKILLNTYSKIKGQIDDYKKLIQELNNQDEKEITQKIFLYFIQEGKCLYSGERIDIEHLEECEIDHIIPQTLIKDDSIENKALLYRRCNQIKGDSLVLPRECRNEERIKWWRHLTDLGLVTKKKFYNLTRKEYNEKDIQGFINRQIVETRQITKHVANIINNLYYDSEEDKKNKKGVIYINANLSHQYREKNDLYKFRNINDFHHAYDAFLAATLGEYVTNVFKKKVNIDYLRETTKELYKNINQENRKEVYKKLGYGLVINSIDNKYALVDEDGVVDLDLDKLNDIMINNYYRNDILVTKKVEWKTGEFYNQTKGKKSNQGQPLKKSLLQERYGYYDSVKCSHLMLVQYKNKKKLIGIPFLVYVQSERNPELLEQFIRTHLNLKENEKYEIIKSHIPFNSKIEIDGNVVVISGYSIAKQTCELQNAKENKFSKTAMIRYKKILDDIFKYQDYIKVKEINESGYKNDVNKLYTYIKNNLKDNYKIFENVTNKVETINDKVDTEIKMKIIKELINMMSSYNGSNANLSFIGKDFTAREGRLSGKNITKGRIIFESTTGVYNYDYEF